MAIFMKKGHLRQIPRIHSIDCSEIQSYTVDNSACLRKKGSLGCNSSTSTVISVPLKLANNIVTHIARHTPRGRMPKMGTTLNVVPFSSTPLPQIWIFPSNNHKNTQGPQIQHPFNPSKTSFSHSKTLDFLFKNSTTKSLTKN